MTRFTDKAWRLVKPADNNTIEAAAAALDAVAIAGLELAAAQKELDAAERKLASTSDAQAAAVATASARLRAELLRRGEEGHRHVAEMQAKADEVKAIFPQLRGTMFGHCVAVAYATGSTAIDAPVALADSTFEPTITDENRKAVERFTPALHVAPDTDALRAVKMREAVALFLRLDAARARHKTAQQALRDALVVFNDVMSALDGELNQEAESIASAAAAQAEADAQAADAAANDGLAAGDAPKP